MNLFRKTVIMNKFETIENIETIISNSELALLIKGLLSDIKKKRWTNEQIQQKLWRRSVDEVIASWETCYMWSCVDITLAFLQELKSIIPSKNLALWCEILQWKKWNITSLHFFIKDDSWDTPKIIDFEKDRKVKIYHWDYKNSREWVSLSQKALSYIPAGNISWKDSLETILSKINVDKSIFSDYLSKVQKDNTDANYSWYLHSRQPLSVSIDWEQVNFNSLEIIKKDVNNIISKVILDNPENERELLNIMNRIWEIIGKIFWYPYWEVVGVERALRSKDNPDLEKKSRINYLRATHEELENYFWIKDTVHVTYIKLRSWNEIDITEWTEWQQWTRNSRKSIYNYIDQVLAYKDSEQAKEFYELMYKFQVIGKGKKEGY